MYKLISVEAAPPITVARAKERLRITGSDDDNDIQQLIDAAILAVEKETGLIIRQSTWDFQGDWLPVCIDRYPIRSITGIYYKDVDEVEQTVAPADYWFIKTPSGAEIFYITGFYNPLMSLRQGRTRIRFTAGYDDGSLTGADPELEFTSQIELAVLFLVGNWYANRELTSQNDQFKVPKTFDHIISQLKVYR